MFHQYILTKLNISIHILQGCYSVSIILFLHKTFFKLGPVWNATLNLNFWISFLILGPTFGIQGKVIVFLSLLLLLLLMISKVINIFCNVFSITSIFAKHISQIFPPLNIFQKNIWYCFSLKYKNIFHCLICTSVKAGLQ